MSKAPMVGLPSPAAVDEGSSAFAPVAKCRGLQTDLDTWKAGTYKGWHLQKVITEAGGDCTCDAVMFAEKGLGHGWDGLTLDKMIGRGSFGLVAKGRRRNGQLLAVKVAGEANLAKVTMRIEMAVYLRLKRHDNVVTCFAMDDSLPNMPIALEYCDAGDLSSVAKDDVKLTDTEKLGLLSDVAAGLKHVHDHGFVHVDIKPDNVLLKKLPEGGLQAKVTDFGLALVEGERRIGQGTVGFMPPETMYDIVQARYHQDTFALGHTALVLLSKTSSRQQNMFFCKTVVSPTEAAACAILMDHPKEKVNAVKKLVIYRNMTSGILEAKLLKEETFEDQLGQHPQFLPGLADMLSPDPSRRPTMRAAQTFFDDIRRDQATTESATPEDLVVTPPTPVPCASTADVGATARAPPARAPERAPGDGGGGGCSAPVLVLAAVGGAGGADHIPTPAIAQGAVTPLSSPPLPPLPSQPLPLQLYSPPLRQAMHKDPRVPRGRGLNASPMVDCLAGGGVAPTPAHGALSEGVRYVRGLIPVVGDHGGKPGWKWERKKPASRRTVQPGAIQHHGEHQAGHRHTVDSSSEWGWGFANFSTEDEGAWNDNRAAAPTSCSGGGSAIQVPSAGSVATGGVAVRMQQNHGGCAAPCTRQAGCEGEPSRFHQAGFTGVRGPSAAIQSPALGGGADRFGGKRGRGFVGGSINFDRTGAWLARGHTATGPKPTVQAGGVPSRPVMGTLEQPRKTEADGGHVDFLVNNHGDNVTLPSQVGWHGISPHPNHQRPLWNRPVPMVVRGQAMEHSSCATIGGRAFTAFPAQAAPAAHRVGARPCSKVPLPPLYADVGGIPTRFAPSPEKRSYGVWCGGHTGGYGEHETCGVSGSAMVSPSGSGSIGWGGERSPPRGYSPRHTTGDGRGAGFTRPWDGANKGSRRSRGKRGRHRGSRGKGGPPTVRERYAGCVSGGPKEGHHCKPSLTYVAGYVNRGGVAMPESAFGYGPKNGPAAYCPARDLYAVPQRCGVGLRW